MSVIRVDKTKNYTVMSNYHLRDERLSLKAVGLMSWMLSLPDNWDYSVAGIASCRKEGKDAIRAILKELEEAGYLVRETKRDENGRFATEFILRENPLADKENNRVGKSATVNPTQINTKEQSTKKESKKEEKRRSYADIINSLVDDPNVKEALQSYLQMRIMQKKAPSNKALILLVERLKELSSKPEEQVAIINQSIRGGYLDFCSLKKKSSHSGKSTQSKKEAVSIPVSADDKAKNKDGSYMVF